MRPQGKAAQNNICSTQLGRRICSHDRPSCHDRMSATLARAVAIFFARATKAQTITEYRDTAPLRSLHVAFSHTVDCWANAKSAEKKNTLSVECLSVDSGLLFYPLFQALKGVPRVSHDFTLIGGHVPCPIHCALLTRCASHC